MVHIRAFLSSLRDLLLFQYFQIEIILLIFLSQQFFCSRSAIIQAVNAANVACAQNFLAHLAKKGSQKDQNGAVTEAVVPVVVVEQNQQIAVEVAVDHTYSNLRIRWKNDNEEAVDDE